MRVRLGLVALVLLAATVGCSRGTSATPAITVMTASSLTDAFNVLARDFTDDTGIAVRVEVGGSAQLVAQLDAGAPGDVLATADEFTMRAAGEAGLVEGPVAWFATNRLAIAVAAGNPKGVTSLADLARPGLLVSMAAAEVPAGRYAREALDNAKVTLKPVSEETSVRGVLTKVTLGEVDAGIVYVSDLASAPSGVEAVAVADEHNVLARYSIATIKGRRRAVQADQFVAFVLSAQGISTLDQFGFGQP